MSERDRQDENQDENQDEDQDEDQESKLRTECLKWLGKKPGSVVKGNRTIFLVRDMSESLQKRLKKHFDVCFVFFRESLLTCCQCKNFVVNRILGSALLTSEDGPSILITLAVQQACTADGEPLEPGKRYRIEKDAKVLVEGGATFLIIWD